MTVSEIFRSNKEIWDERYDLPLVPIHNNPFIYAAYATRIIEEYETPDYIGNLQHYAFNRCAVSVSCFFGLYHRWPDGFGGEISHDEILGLCYISPMLARSVMSYLKSNFGFYNNIHPTRLKLGSFMFRFPFLYPFVKIRSGYKLDLLSYVTFFLYLYFSANFTKASHSGSILLQWIMVEGSKKKYPKLVSYWINKMNSRGLSPKKCFETYLERCPEFHKYAPDQF